MTDNSNTICNFNNTSNQIDACLDASEVILNLKELPLPEIPGEDEDKLDLMSNERVGKINQILVNNSVKVKKYTMYNVQIKRQCVELARNIDPKIVAKVFGVPLKSLKRWLLVGPDRQKGGGRKIRDPQMEKRLFEWYIHYHIIGKMPVTSKMIKNKALEFSQLDDFHASKGWLEKLKKKYNLQISRSSSASKIKK